MAYQEFANPNAAEAPDIGDMPRTLQALQYVNQQKERALQARRTAAQNLKEFTINGKDTPSVERLTKEAQDVKNETVNDIMNYGSPRPETIKKRDKIELAHNIMKTVDEQTKSTLEEIGKWDKYMNKGKAIGELGEVATFNPPENMDLMEHQHERANRLLDFQNKVNSAVKGGDHTPEYYNNDLFTADWVTKQHEKNKSKWGVGTDEEGKNSGSTEAPLVDSKGNPNVEPHINAYLESDPRVLPTIQHEAMQQIEKNVENNIASDKNWLDKAGRALYGKPFQSKEEAINDLFNHPNNNIVPETGELQPSATDENGRILKFNDRVRNIAKEKLEEYNNKSSEYLHDVSKNNHSFGANKNSSVNVQYDNGSTAPGLGLIINHKDKPIPYVNFQPNKYYNLSTGQNVKNVNHLDFNANNYVLVLRKKNGDLVPFKAQDHDQLLEEIKNTPAKDLIGSDLTWAMKGQAINKANESSALDAMSAEMAKNPSPALAAAIQALKDFKSGASGISPEPLAVMQKLSGMPNMITDMMIEVPRNGSAEANLKGFTGVNLHDPKILNRPEFKDVIDSFNQKKKESKIPEEAVKSYWESPKGKSDLSKIKNTVTQDEWSNKWKSLKSGEKMIGLDGKEYTKK